MLGTVVLVAATVVRSAWAAPGRLRITRTQLPERNGTWRLLLAIELPTPPSSNTVQLSFAFEQHVDFVKGTGPEVERRRVQPPRELSVVRDVDFRSLSGEAGRTGRVELELQRAEGFRAGQWTLHVLREDATAIGAAAALVLLGTNDEPLPTDEEPKGPGASEVVLR